MIQRKSKKMVIVIATFIVTIMGCSQITNAVSLLNLSKKKAPAHSKNERMKWFREARFGMFIHWGIYSVPAGIYKGLGGGLLDTDQKRPGKAGKV